MSHFSRSTLLGAIAVVLSGCASQGVITTPGKHLVYRNASGEPIRQFDYPSDDFCSRVESLAGRTARCQAESAGTQLKTKATLRYNPPGVLVEGHYADLVRCRVDTSTLAPGVQLVKACAPK